MCYSRITFLTLPFLFLLALISVNAQNSPTKLQPGSTVERTLGPNESHTYTIELTDEQYLQFVVNQHGVDVMVRVFAPTGKSLGDFDTPNGAEGPENVSIVSITGGTYRIVVSPLDPSSEANTGRYEIKTLELRQATDQELSVGRGDQDRREKGLKLLNEIVDSLAEIRQTQTRTSVKLQSASLLWNIDDKKAARLLTEAVHDARDYLLSMKIEDDAYDQIAQWVQQIRFEAIQTLSTHDPEAALNLLRSTRKPITSENERREQEPERQFEMAIAGQIAAKNPQRAFELAEASLKDSYQRTLNQTLHSLRRANPELANTLAKDVMAKLLNEKLLANGEAAELALTLVRGSYKPAAGTGGIVYPLLSEAEYRALTQKLFSDAMAVTEPIKSVRLYNNGYYSSDAHPEMILMQLKRFFGSELDNIVPGGSALIEKKLGELNATVDESQKQWEEFESQIRSSPPEEAKAAISQAPPEIKNQLFQRLAESRLRSGEFSQAQQVIIENVPNPRERKRLLNNLEQQAAYADASAGRMEDALKHIAKMSNPASQADLISEIAGRIGPGQKRASALNLLETARAILGAPVQADGQAQMRALIQLAGAFSRYDAKKGFEILEPLIDQFNDLSQAAKTLNGFGPEYFVDGELSMRNGNSLANIGNSLASTVGILSLVDFDRAKSISDRLALPEVRIPAHLGIAQQSIAPNGVYSPSVAYVNNLNR